MDPILEMAGEHDLTVIEDNAECVLGYYHGRVVGSMGDMASFSFQSSKHLTAGEGGMLITDDEELALRARRFGNLGFAPTHAKAGGAKMPRDTIQDPRFERHLSLGWNYRMSELCAAVALAQTERMEEIVDQRRKVAGEYRKVLRDCSWLVPQKTPQGYVHSYWTYVLRLENGGAFSWYEFRKRYLACGGDGFYAAWVPVHLEPAFRSRGYGPGLCPVTEGLQPKLIQMKTSYGDMAVARRKAEALAETIDFFNSRYDL
jgi:perosamine synthetase